MWKKIIFLLSLTSLINFPVTAENPVIGYLEIRLADFDKMREIIKQGTDLNAFDSDDFSPLFMSVWLGDIEVAKFLIENGANVNLVRSDGATPIFLAPTADMVDFLISQGANLEHTTPYGFTPLTSAILNENTYLAEHLVKIGADVNVLKLEGKSPLNMLNERENSYVKRREKKLRDLIIAAGGKDIDIHSGERVVVEENATFYDSNCATNSEERNKRKTQELKECDVDNK